MPGATGVRSAAPSLKSQQRLAKEMERVQEPGAIRLNDLVQTYPRVAFAPDTRDTDMKIRAEIRESPDVAATMAIGQEDVDYIKSKRRQEEQLAFDMWKANLFDLTDPVTAAWVRIQIDPNIFTLQEQYLDSALDVAKRFTKINMMGVQSHDDLEFLWMVKTGQIHVPAGFLPEQLQLSLPGTDQSHVTPTGFTVESRGLFNPMRWLGQNRDAARTGWNANNAINAWVDPTKSSLAAGSSAYGLTEGYRNNRGGYRGLTSTGEMFPVQRRNWSLWTGIVGNPPPNTPYARALEAEERARAQAAAAAGGAAPPVPPR